MGVPRRIAISGVTGLIGRGLPEMFSACGWDVTGISRAGGGKLSHVDRWQTPETMDFSGQAAVVNLAGEPITGRWTEERFTRFRESRVGHTARVVDAIARLAPEDRPSVLINGSAVGIYGDRGEELLDENAAPGDDRLAQLCVDWENAALAAQDLGVRVVLLRTGIVLGKSSGAWQAMSLPFRLGLGGRLGNGRQWMPWIALDDMRSLVLHAVEHETLAGPVNATAPGPVRNKEFTRELAASLHRPAFFHVPGWALKLALGEFGSVLLGSQRATPNALLESGFRFHHPELRGTLRNLAG